jgi:aminomuconate-semialdehyde/2-hydroxymuconate-6-semialdehyde dehydrogenase
MMNRILNYVGGERVAPNRGEFLETFNPAIGRPHGHVADSTEEDVDQAVGAARRAFPSWSRLSADERSVFLRKIADLIETRLMAFAEAESLDQGKPVALAARMDIPRAIQNFRFFASAILHQQDPSSQMDAQTFNYVVREPVGVAGLISPWNLPLYLLTWKIAPAIAYGNTVVCKPSEFTSLTASLFADVMIEAKLPPGVVNIVFGTGPRVGAPLVAHPDVPLISFTGGTATGKAIAGVAAPLFKKLSLELGGKNPNIIFDDADLEKAVETTVRSSFLNQGEICLCGSRIYVQSSIYDAFVSKFLARVSGLKIGDPREAETFMGPVVSREHFEKIQGFLSEAREAGFRFLAGGEKPSLAGEFAHGYFIAPTVIEGAPSSSRLIQEEVFGPVVTLSKFETEDEVVGLANGVRYGLSATVWTQSLKRAHGISARLHAGTVWVNTWLKRDLRMPFGGVKASGVGREGQNDSLEFFTEAKTICIQHS